MRPKITKEMYAAVTTLMAEGKTKPEIAAIYGVTPGTLQVMCSKRGISLRKGGPLPKRTNLTLPDEPLPLSDEVLKSLREATRSMGKDSTARLKRRSLQGSAGRGGCVMIWRLLACEGSKETTK